MWTLPFYLFGANDQNSCDRVDSETRHGEHDRALSEVAHRNGQLHPTHCGATRLAHIIVGPRDGHPAMRVNNANEQLDGFAVMSAVLNVLSAIRDANGEGSTNNQYYAPLLMVDAQGTYYPPGGGRGGSRGTGDYDYAGIFIHEQGHAFGMPHAGEAYDAGKYPYAGGSLLGSVWGYDASRQDFGNVHPGGSRHGGRLPRRPSSTKGRSGSLCQTRPDAQSGSGDQAPGYKYTMFSDFNASVIQQYFEGSTTLGDGGVHEYDGGTIFVDPSSSTGYSRWDTLDIKRVEVPIETTTNGLYGLDQGLALPSARGVPVHAIVLTFQPHRHGIEQYDASSR